MIDIFVEPTGMGGERSHVARAYLGDDLVAGVVFAYGASQGEARGRLTQKLKSWSTEQIKLEKEKGPVCSKCNDSGVIVYGVGQKLDCDCRASAAKAVNGIGGSV